MAQWGKPYITERKVTVGGIRQIVKETKVDLWSSPPWMQPGPDDKVELTIVTNIEIRTDSNGACHENYKTD